MEADNQRNSDKRTYFNLPKPMDKWDDFKNTWKNIKFEDSLNNATREDIEMFWHRQFEALNNQTEKICILVPNEVEKTIQSQDQNSNIAKIGVNGKIQNSQEKNISKAADESSKPKTNQKIKLRKQGKGNFKQSKYIPKVKLSQSIKECAMSVISKYPHLNYQYESLFMGNDKQLLIYRSCNYLDKYLQKYRLPNNFNDIIGDMKALINHYYEIKIKRNVAISTFNERVLEKLNAEANLLKEKTDLRLVEFKPYFANILKDFRSKPKCRQIILINIREQLKQLLQSICQQNQTEAINRYNECNSDQFKDILILKKEDPKLYPAMEPQPYEEQKVQYIYVIPQRQPQPPKDILGVTYNGIDFKKMCYMYNIIMPRCGKQNKYEGIFIRSEEGQQNYELNINIKEQVKNIDVEIYPFRHGKSIYQIYIWNNQGFTKSTEKIVLYNELGFGKSQSSLVKNYQIYFLGQNQTGLIVDEQSVCKPSTEDQFVKFKLTGKDVAIDNGGVLCDKRGDVAGWGQMFFFKNDTEQQNKQDSDNIIIEHKLNENLQIESPCLLLGGKNIRKVSCGMGYFLMLSTFGQIYSTGLNQFGQLGLGHFRNQSQNMDPQVICKFTDSTSPFIVDIKANSIGSSFATDENGQLYRWGFNQVQETKDRIFDRFNSVINYSTNSLLYKCCNPFRINKTYIQGKVRQLETGSSFYLAVNHEGVLFGWGETKYLGCGPLLNMEQKEIADIVNPIQIMSNINYITVGSQHCVAVMKNKTILGWGNGSAFSKNHQKFTKKPIDLTEQYGDISQIKLIKAGKDFTVIVSNTNDIDIIGCEEVFKKQRYSLSKQVKNVVCSPQGLVGVLTELTT